MTLKLETLCGIIGIWAKNKKGEEEFEKMSSAIETLAHRGPDNQAIKTHSKVSLGHARLSIIDPNEGSNQPMTDPSGRYSLVFNGEIYNYQQIKIELELEGIRFVTRSDTEVLLHLLITKGEAGINRLNGFFTFIFYDNEREQILFARDRLGIKPLIIYEDDSKIILASEMSALFDFDIDKTIDEVPLNLYFRLGYMPAPTAILKRAYKILPGQLGVINQEGMELKKYYSIKRLRTKHDPFVDAADELRSKINIAVRDRLVSDVPLGAFLSGGVDSSIIAAVAKRYKDDLQTFSIGFDHPFFNETEFSQLAAKHIGSRHHEFIIGKKEFKDNFEAFLDSIDEPFGDSSAFAVYFLAQETKKQVSVALSGDGADELFGGYNKHLAELALRDMGRTKKSAIRSLSKAMKSIPTSRADRIGNFNRKVKKLSGGFELNNEQRYFEWCSFVSREDVFYLMESSNRREVEWKGIKIEDMNDYLIADQHMVLTNDMLKKVDMMSMAHSLEVRTPFLDHGVVEFANSLPRDYKIKPKGGKLILKYAYKDYLPREILHRKKRGFEIPLQDWLGDELTELLNSELFSKSFIQEQDLFDYEFIKDLIKSINSSHFGEKIYLVWSLIIFQHWYKKFYV